MFATVFTHLPFGQSIRLNFSILLNLLGWNGSENGNIRLKDETNNGNKFFRSSCSVRTSVLGNGREANFFKKFKFYLNKTRPDYCTTNISKPKLKKRNRRHQFITPENASIYVSISAKIFPKNVPKRLILLCTCRVAWKLFGWPKKKWWSAVQSAPWF